MDSVKLRLERDQPLSFLEFNYMILQSYDFVELHKRQNCILQMGGSDQWGNIVMGADLGRRMQGADLFALTTPLIATASGAKMGKTTAGAVWLNAERRLGLRLLAVLAQHRGRGCRPLPEALHRDAARRGRAARGAEGPGDQRGQEDPGHRDHRPGARPAGRRGSGRNGAPHLRGRRAGRDAADRQRAARAAGRRHRRRSSCCTRPAWPKAATRRAS